MEENKNVNSCFGEKRIKIGILTWFFAKNYGARAHAFALFSVLDKLGFDVEFINFKPREIMKFDLRYSLSKSIIASSRGIKQLVFFYTNSINAKIGKKVRCADDINRINYDTIILGSDEIFNVLHPGFNEIYMGVGLSCKNIITYAVGCGEGYAEDISESCIQSIEKLRGVSVRDCFARDFINKNTGKESLIHLDPTLLIDEDMSQVDRKIEEKYILVYAFSSLTEIKNEIKQYAKKNKLKIIRIGMIPKGGYWADKNILYLSLDEWKGMFFYSELVITDSYHGTIFAIKNKKNFVIIKKTEKICKIEGLINQLEICKEFYDGKEDFEDYVNNRVDYSNLDHIIIKERERVFLYFYEHIR